jgi:glyoxylase-like metal-dependent hydrolase (beta-lactamase superfamily II)
MKETLVQQVRCNSRAARSRLAIQSLVLVVGFCLLLVLFTSRGRNGADLPNLSGPPHEILSGAGLYYLGADHSYSHSASYALKTSQGIIVVDPGLRFSMIQAAFQSLGLDMTHVKIVLVTHRHADHWFAARELVQRSGATVMAHEQDAGVLTEAADLGQYYSCYPAPIVDVPIVDNVRALANGELIRLGDCEIEVIATAGHTPGSACYRTRVQGKHIMFSGDTVLALTPESFGGDYMTRMGPRFGGDMESYLNALRRLSSISVDILLPGHPAYGSKVDSFLGPGEWQALLQPNISKLESWLRDYAAEVKLFLDGVPKALTGEILYLGERRATACYVIKTADGAILIDPGQRTIADITTLLNQLGRDAEHLMVVLVTSLHSEHCASAMELCAGTGAKLYTGPPGDPGLIEETESELRPDRILGNGDEFELGGVRITALDNGAGDMSYMARISDRAVLIGGDNVARFPLGPHEQYHEHTRQPKLEQEVAFYKLLKRQPVEIVLPAHPRYDESPFYLPGEWQWRTRSF